MLLKGIIVDAPVILSTIVMGLISFSSSSEVH